LKVTGTGKVPSNVTPPNEKSFENKKEDGKAEIEEGKDNIHTNPFSKVGDAALGVAGKVIESGMPYPLAPEAEQKRRSDTMEKTVKRKVNENIKNKN